ncbi:MAG: protein translocase subunit SecD, partial [Candidatus Niyogibacteria bacterium]|nr:protein translocase subunit SecD [Candidatus Niyogibacteria bacterium]
MFKIRVAAFAVFIAGLALGYFAFANFINPAWFLGGAGYRLGLDLQGGSHLVYSADVSGVSSDQVKESMEGLRDVIERRVNAFGVAEPVVQVESSGSEERLIVELAGVFNVDEAVRLIGQTPYLEFKTERSEGERDSIVEAQQKGGRLTEDPYFIPTALTGRYLEKSILDFSSSTNEPSVLLEFNEEGGRLFAELTRENVGKRIAIYLDGEPISIPVVNEEVSSG